MSNKVITIEPKTTSNRHKTLTSLQIKYRTSTSNKKKVYFKINYITKKKELRPLTINIVRGWNLHKQFKDVGIDISFETSKLKKTLVGHTANIDVLNNLIIPQLTSSQKRKIMAHKVPKINTKVKKKKKTQVVLDHQVVPEPTITTTSLIQPVKQTKAPNLSMPKKRRRTKRKKKKVIEHTVSKGGNDNDDDVYPKPITTQPQIDRISMLKSILQIDPNTQNPRKRKRSVSPTDDQIGQTAGLKGPPKKKVKVDQSINQDTTPTISKDISQPPQLTDQVVSSPNTLNQGEFKNFDTGRLKHLFLNFTNFMTLLGMKAPVQQPEDIIPTTIATTTTEQTKKVKKKKKKVTTTTTKSQIPPPPEITMPKLVLEDSIFEQWIKEQQCNDPKECIMKMHKLYDNGLLDISKIRYKYYDIDELKL